MPRKVMSCAHSRSVVPVYRICTSGSSRSRLEDKVGFDAMQDHTSQDGLCATPASDERSLRKAHKRQVKQAKREVREMTGDAVASHRKLCDDCRQPRDVLVRCRSVADGPWRLVCTKGCWQRLTGGQVDGVRDSGYQYGGMWSNPYALKNAHRPKSQANDVHDWSEGVHFARNDRTLYEGQVYECRRTHDAERPPAADTHHWKPLPAVALEA